MRRRFLFAAAHLTLGAGFCRFDMSDRIHIEEPLMRVLLFVCLLPMLAFAQAPALDSTYIPANVHVTSSAPQSATLEWSKVDGATAYRVWYGISSDNLDYAGDTPFPQFQKSHLMEGAKYFFAISTVIDTKESPRSVPLTCQLPSG